MGKIPIALQLYSIREECAKDLPGCLKAVAEMGYEGVEFAGYHGFSACEIRKMLDDNGLKAAGAHVGIDTLLGEEFAKSVELHRTLGNPYPIVPGLPGDYTNSRDAWRKTADVFNEIAAKLRRENMWTGYHNHHTEFTALDGEMPWDTFFGNTDQDIVMQLDTGNAMHGGATFTPFISRYPGRALTVHLKPYSATLAKESEHAGFRPIIGDDETDWSELFGLCESIGGTRWYIVEYESDLHPPMVAVDLCLKALRGMGK